LVHVRSDSRAEGGCLGIDAVCQDGRGWGERDGAGKGQGARGGPGKSCGSIFIGSVVYCEHSCEAKATETAPSWEIYATSSRETYAASNSSRALRVCRRWRGFFSLSSLAACATPRLCLTGEAGSTPWKKGATLGSLLSESALARRCSSTATSRSVFLYFS